VVRRGILARPADFIGAIPDGGDLAFKWKKPDTFESAAALSRARAWLIERYATLPKPLG